MQNFGRQTRCIMGRMSNGEYVTFRVSVALGQLVCWDIN